MFKNFFALSMIVAAATGCSSVKTTIFARDNGSFFVTSSASSPQKAREAAFHAAQTYCEKLGKRLISENNSRPSGWDQASNLRIPNGTWAHDKQDGAIQKNEDVEKTKPSDVTSTASRISVDFRCI